MAYIRKRKNSYSVVYRVKNAEGIEHQKSESYATQKEAEKRKKEIEYKTVSWNLCCPEMYQGERTCAGVCQNLWT